MGICLGMQILFDTSEENGLESGLGLIKGDVKKIVLSKQDRLNKLKIPNIGWHNIIINNKSKIFNDIEKNFNCYFVHSYHEKLKNLNECLADIDYGSNQLTSIVKKDNIYGCQFHPEKSGIDGLKIIKNFLDLG